MRRRWTVGAILAVAGAALTLSLQPIRSSWWSFADPDGAYVGSSLNILDNHTNHLDHPGLPTQDALALAFGAQYLVEKATGDHDSRQAFADETMLDLDDARWLYRGWASVLFLGSALLVYVLVGRLLGHCGVSRGVCSSSPRPDSVRCRSSCAPTRQSPHYVSRSATSR
jgi:hypothetical protein